MLASDCRVQVLGEIVVDIALDDACLAHCGVTEKNEFNLENEERAGAFADVNLSGCAALPRIANRIY